MYLYVTCKPAPVIQLKSEIKGFTRVYDIIAVVSLGNRFIIKNIIICDRADVRRRYIGQAIIRIDHAVIKPLCCSIVYKLREYEFCGVDLTVHIF